MRKSVLGASPMLLTSPGRTDEMDTQTESVEVVAALMELEKGVQLVDVLHDLYDAAVEAVLDDPQNYGLVGGRG